MLNQSRLSTAEEVAQEIEDCWDATEELWCMAVFSVGEVICLVTLFDDRDLGLLNHVKFDSCLITSQRDRSRTHL